MDMETFIGTCIKEMISEGVSVEFTKRKITGKFGYNFFYDGQHPKYGKKVLFKIHFYNNSLEENYSIFVHEYCHFLQWREKIPLWDIARQANNRLDDWLQEKSEIISIEDIRTIQRLELDCDKRVLDHIIKYDLPINADRYKLESNGYILSYNFIFKNREFYVSDAYSSDEAIKYLPTEHITEDQLGLNIPEFEEIFMQNV